MDNLNYTIGDKLFASCYTDFDFTVQIQIMAISNFDLANDQYESIFVKMFNTDNGQELLEQYRNSSSTVYFYICKVLEGNGNHQTGDYIVLTDDLINDKYTYYLNEEVDLYFKLDFSTGTSSFRNTDSLLTGLRSYLESNGVNIVKVNKEKTYDEKLITELNEYRSIINSLKGLKGMESNIDKMINNFDKMSAKMEEILKEFEDLK